MSKLILYKIQENLSKQRNKNNNIADIITGDNDNLEKKNAQTDNSNNAKIRETITAVAQYNGITVKSPECTATIVKGYLGKYMNHII